MENLHFHKHLFQRQISKEFGINKQSVTQKAIKSNPLLKKQSKISEKI